MEVVVACFNMLSMSSPTATKESHEVSQPGYLLGAHFIVRFVSITGGSGCSSYELCTGAEWQDIMLTYAHSLEMAVYYSL
jgi:hypothetical protein